MLTRLDLRGLADVSSRLPRPATEKDLPLESVRAIIDEVRTRGDAALRRLTAELDGVELGGLRVTSQQLKAALESTPRELRDALEAARDAILDYHSSSVVEPAPYRRQGLEVREIRQPVRRAGIYVPGGRARYPSTVLMTAIPAQVAGVEEVALCVPPGSSGAVASETLAAAAVTGLEEVYTVGGAQAIAALAYGTETVPAVDLVTGPGNLYVSLAKREVAGLVAVPSSFSGPSEVVVIGDESTPAELAAIDLVVQAEHGPDGLAWLVTWSEELAESVPAEIERCVLRSPRRSEIASTLSRGGYDVLVDGPAQAMEVANHVAPEHLEIMSADPGSLLPMVKNAGAVFTGPFSPASVGDYIAGPSHVLPTAGSARFAGSLGVEDFVKRVHVVSLDRRALRSVAGHVAALAEAEGLDAHARSVQVGIRS